MRQPIEFKDQAHPDHVCCLQKSLYGLCQANRVWNSTFTNFLTANNLKPTNEDPCVYVSNNQPPSHPPHLCRQWTNMLLKPYSNQPHSHTDEWGFPYQRRQSRRIHWPLYPSRPHQPHSLYRSIAPCRPTGCKVCILICQNGEHSS